MSLTNIGYNGLMTWPPRATIGITAFDTSGSSTVMDATDEEVHFIGNLALPSGTSSATFDTTTTIGFMLSTTTFANAGTTLRIGVQDVDAVTGVPGRGDGTFDCYADYVGGTDTLTGSAWNTITMETGSKVVSNNDLIAICFKLTARGGSDSITISTHSTSGFTAARPLVVYNTGAGFAAKTSALPTVAINFNGTWATLAQTYPFTARTNTSFNSGSTPDEIGNLFTLPFACNIAGIVCRNVYGAASTTFDVKAYTTPLGTPTLITGLSLTVDTDTLVGTSSGDEVLLFAAPVRVEASTQIAVTLTPVSTTSIGLSYLTTTTSTVMGLLPCGLNCTYCARSDGSGAFTETNTRRAILELLISDIETGAGGGGPLIDGRLVK